MIDFAKCPPESKCEVCYPPEKSGLPKALLAAIVGLILVIVISLVLTH